MVSFLRLILGFSFALHTYMYAHTCAPTPIQEQAHIYALKTTAELYTTYWKEKMY